MTDSLEGRVGRLEIEHARSDQRIEDLGQDVRALMPLIVSLAEVRGEVAAARKELHECTQRVSEVRRKFDEAQQQEHWDKQRAQELQEEQRKAEQRDAKSHRRTLYGGMALVVLSSLAGLVVQLILQGAP